MLNAKNTMNSDDLALLHTLIVDDFLNHIIIIIIRYYTDCGSWRGFPSSAEFPVGAR